MAVWQNNGMNLPEDPELVGNSEKTLALDARAEALRQAQEYFSKFRPAGVLWSEEIIQERRKEARRERED